VAAAAGLLMMTMMMSTTIDGQDHGVVVIANLPTGDESSHTTPNCPATTGSYLILIRHLGALQSAVRLIISRSVALNI